MEQDWAAFAGQGPQSDVLHFCRPASCSCTKPRDDCYIVESSNLYIQSHVCACRWGRTAQDIATGQVAKLRAQPQTAHPGGVAETENLVAGKGEAVLAEADVAGPALVATGSVGLSLTCQTCQQQQLQPALDLSPHALHLKVLHLLQDLCQHQHLPPNLLLHLLLNSPATKL